MVGSSERNSLHPFPTRESIMSDITLVDATQLSMETASEFSIPESLTDSVLPEGFAFSVDECPDDKWKTVKKGLGQTRRWISQIELLTSIKNSNGSTNEWVIDMTVELGRKCMMGGFQLSIKEAGRESFTRRSTQEFLAQFCEDGSVGTTLIYRPSVTAPQQELSENVPADQTQPEGRPWQLACIRARQWMETKSAEELCTAMLRVTLGSNGSQILRGHVLGIIPGIYAQGRMTQDQRKKWLLDRFRLAPGVPSGGESST
jgi:hypothetical protein